MSSETSFAIIGAGISGLATAFNISKTARRTGNSVKLVLYDKNPTPGGTWSATSVYDGLITNNSWTQMLLDDDGLAEKEFQEDSSIGAGPGGFRATGEGMTRIMDHAVRQVRALGGEIRSSTVVTSVTQPDNKHWQVASMSVTSPEQTVIESFDKLVVATGSFSTPVVPPFATPYAPLKGQPIRDPLGPLAIHTSHLSDPSTQTALFARKRDIIVVGASKSALDAAERLALNDHQVTMVFRNAPYLAPPASTNPKTGAPADAVAGVGTRLKTSYVPYFRDPVSGVRSTGGLLASLFRYVLHTSWWGSFLHRKVVNTATRIFSNWGQWAKPYTSDMKPEIDLMWSESSLYPGPASLPSLIQAKKVKVLKGTVIGMAESTSKSNPGYTLRIRSSDDNSIITREVQCVIFGTGWSTGTYPFFSPDLVDELGLPVEYTDKPPKREADYVTMDDSSLKDLLRDQRTLARPPKLWELPSYSARQAGRTPCSLAPYRLYRLMVPLSHLKARDVAFPGVPVCKANHVLLLVQAHWIADYFFDLLPTIPSDEIVKQEISFQSVWSRRLFGPAHGRLGQWLGGTWIEYCGRLCRDMGVSGDGQGLTGVVNSQTYQLEKKRVARDQAKGLNVLKEGG